MSSMLFILLLGLAVGVVVAVQRWWHGPDDHCRWCGTKHMDRGDDDE